MRASVNVLIVAVALGCAGGCATDVPFQQDVHATNPHRIIVEDPARKDERTVDATMRLVDRMLAEARARRLAGAK